MGNQEQEVNGLVERIMTVWNAGVEAIDIVADGDPAVKLHLMLGWYDQFKSELKEFEDDIQRKIDRNS